MPIYSLCRYGSEPRDPTIKIPSSPHSETASTDTGGHATTSLPRKRIARDMNLGYTYLELDMYLFHLGRLLENLTSSRDNSLARVLNDILKS